MKTYKIQRDYAVEFGADRPELVGIGITYNTYSVDLGGYREVIAPSAFDDFLRGPHDVRILYDHQDAHILARESNGTNALDPKPDKLVVRFSLDETTLGKDTFIRVRDRLVTKMSVGIRVLEEQWHDLESDLPTGIITKAILDEVSLVGCPAFDATDVRLMSLADARKKKSLSEEEQRRRNATLASIKFDAWRIENQINVTR